MDELSQCNFVILIGFFFSSHLFINNNHNNNLASTKINLPRNGSILIWIHLQAIWEYSNKKNWMLQLTKACPSSQFLFNFDNNYVVEVVKGDQMEFWLTSRGKQIILFTLFMACSSLKMKPTNVFQHILMWHLSEM